MIFNKIDVRIINGEHKGKIGHIRSTEDNCFCRINNFEASDCECEKMSEVFFDDENVTYSISHADMQLNKGV